MININNNVGNTVVTPTQQPAPQYTITKNISPINDSVSFSSNEEKKHNKNLASYIIAGIAIVGGGFLLAVNLKKGKKPQSPLTDEEVLKRVKDMNNEYHNNIQMFEDINKKIKTQYEGNLEKYLNEDGAKLDSKIKDVLRKVYK